MKITFICDTLKVGGPQRVIVALANELINYGYNICIVTVKNDLCDYTLSPHVQHITASSFSRIKVLRIIEKCLWYRRFLSSDNSDCIISFYYTINMNLMLWKKLGNKNRIIISERNDPNNEPSLWLIRYIRNHLYRYADGIVFQTEDAQRYYEFINSVPHCIIANPMRLDLPEKYKGIRRRAIVNFCRITKQKNLPLLINAFQTISKSHPDIVLEIYGDGPKKREINKYIARKGLSEKVRIFDAQKDVHWKIYDALMFVSSSDYEGISNSMLEALGMGLPTICTDCPSGGARQTIKNLVNGILVPTNNPSALIDAITYIISNPEKAEEMGEKAFELRNELSVFRVASEWDEFIHDRVGVH